MLVLIAQVSATLVFVLAVVNTARRGVKQDGTEFDLVSTSMYSVLAYVGLGSVGLWAFFRSCSLPLTAAEVLFRVSRGARTDRPIRRYRVPVAVN